MTPVPNPLLKLLKDDRRFPLEAYQFVRESLSYAQDELSLGAESSPDAAAEADKEAGLVERHLTGQQLCEAIRQYALQQYGYMAQIVLENWGIRSTSNFGDIVYNLIGIGLMKKSDHDRREDFDDVYDFDDVFCKRFEITPPD